MACFVVPAAEAVVTTVVTKVIKSKETEEVVKVSLSDGTIEERTKTGFSTKLGWLNKMLIGGSVLLALEHFWHGEIIAAFPFLSAIQVGDTAGMLSEMATTGVAMSILVTAVWGLMVAVSAAIEKKAEAKSAAQEVA